MNYPFTNRIRLVRALVEQLGTEKAAHLWLNTPHREFKGRCPGDFFGCPEERQLAGLIFWRLNDY